MALPLQYERLTDSRIERLTNCFLLRNHQIVREDLWVRKGKILNPEIVFYHEKKTPDIIIDCGGALIAPGFIDLQINGGFGVDFTHEGENVDEGVTKVAKAILQHGVTSFCPTIVSSSSNVYGTLLPRLRKRMGGPEGASVLGVHLEGPFINLDRKGAHDAGVIQNEFKQGFDSVKEMYGPMSNVIIVTLAPELPNALDVIESLVNEKVIVSLGHSMSDYETAINAIDRGASFITHLFNAMMPFHHRDPGLIGILGSHTPINFGIIADGTHTHPAVLRIAYRSHPEGLVLVTDAISAYGLPEGTHHLGRFSVDVKDGKAFIANTDTLCGSITGLIECVKFFKESSGCSLIDALESASLHPARVLKIEKVKGTLNYGADADFIMLNDNLDVLQTWIAGRRVYQNEKVQDFIFSYEPAEYEEVGHKRGTVVYFNKSTHVYES